MADETSITRGVSNPNNAARYTGGKSIARSEKVGYNRSNVGGNQKKTGSRSTKRQ